MEDSINSGLEKIFKVEDSRLQNTLTKLQETNVMEDNDIRPMWAVCDTLFQLLKLPNSAQLHRASQCDIISHVEQSLFLFGYFMTPSLVLHNNFLCLSSIPHVLLVFPFVPLFIWQELCRCIQLNIILVIKSLPFLSCMDILFTQCLPVSSSTYVNNPLLLNPYSSGLLLSHLVTHITFGDHIKFVEDD